MVPNTNRDTCIKISRQRIGPKGGGAILVHAGEHGCLVKSRSLSLWLLPFHEAKTGGHADEVIDPTGGGSTFLRSYAIDCLESKDIAHAACWDLGTSFAFEQAGMPKKSNAGDMELWKEANVFGRLKKYIPRQKCPPNAVRLVTMSWSHDSLRCGTRRDASMNLRSAIWDDTNSPPLTMPHSVTSSGSAAQNDDEMLPDAPAGNGVKLEDMFDGDDDEEFPASEAQDVKMESSPAPEPPLAQNSAAAEVDTEIMLAFYQRLFPFRYLFQWLNHGIVPTRDFGNREFALTLQNDAYLRYQSYPTADLFRKDILKMNPSRFEIGPVYSTNPRDRKTLRGGQMKPVSKELVFDIDMTDYDDIRTCCQEANICHKCWAFVTMAIKVVDTALREDFGFEHILWVYSGRRGVHAWVCDPRARNLPDERRRAIMGYMEVLKGGSQTGKRVNLKRPLHPHVARSLDILKNYFAQTTLADQDTFETLKRKWDSSPGRPSTNKWADIDALAKTGKSSKLNTSTLRDAKQDIVLEYTYPRLDAEVSKKMIHLLKSPFVIHPKTGRICVPIDPKNADEFDPLAVPTVSNLLAEIDAYDAKHPAGTAEAEVPDMEGSAVNGSDIKGTRKLQDYEKTSLKPYIDHFRSFIANLLKEERVVKREREETGPAIKADPMEF
ncbi:hypothetical protein N7470_005388 [Penicillium chermesinum]|nr:hypothetical protein N7470_005388 [Penicillium chermesinum]